MMIGIVRVASFAAQVAGRSYAYGNNAVHIETN
jgi:hypothetical protein